MMKLRILVAVLVLLPLASTVQASAYAVRIVGAGTAASCTDAALSKALAGGGPIGFNCGLAAATINITTEKNIAINTSIDGGGRITLNAGGRTRLFYVNSGKTLTLRGLTITGGSGIGNAHGANRGGAIFNMGTLSITNVTFKSNKSPKNGGAIYNDFQATTNIDASDFTSNSAIGDSKQGGGAIFSAAQAFLTVSNTTFTGNIATPGTAGAIFNRVGTVTVTNCTFTNNTGFLGGGAIYSDTGPFTVTDSTFTGNKGDAAKGQGGAIHSDSPFTINHSTFTGNSSSLGGAISTTGRPGGNLVTITNSTFTGNTANNSGAIFVATANMTIVGTVISGNVGSFVGAIFHNGDSIVTLKDTAITNNTWHTGGSCVGTFVDGGGNKQYPDARCGATIPVTP